MLFRSIFRLHIARLTGFLDNADLSPLAAPLQTAVTTAVGVVRGGMPVLAEDWMRKALKALNIKTIPPLRKALREMFNNPASARRFT